MHTRKVTLDAMDNLKMVLMCCLWCANAATSDFQEEVARLLRRVRMSSAHVGLVPRVQSDVQRVLNTRWPGTEVTQYGSIVAGLGIVSSDIDFSVELPVPFDIDEVKRTLDQYPHLFQRTRTASIMVPLVKLLHAPTGHSIDLSFQNEAAVRRTAWMKYLMDGDDRVLDLTMVVRYWAKLHKPEHSQRDRIMANLAMVSLVIFYLQQVRVLPPVTALQENVQEIIVEEWNMAIDEKPRLSNNASLYELLGGFFQYYDKFDFENMIVSTYTAQPIKKTAFKNIALVPELFTLYKQNLKNGIEPLNATSPLVIQDPFNHNKNIASDITQEVLMKFKSDIKFAAEAYVEAKDEFLRVILDNSFPVLPDNQCTKRRNVWTHLNSSSCCSTC